MVGECSVLRERACVLIRSNMVSFIMDSECSVTLGLDCNTCQYFKPLDVAVTHLFKMSFLTHLRHNDNKQALYVLRVFKNFDRTIVKLMFHK